MININEFNNSLAKKVDSGKITCNFDFFESDIIKNEFLMNDYFPENIYSYFENYKPVEISNKNNSIKLLPISEVIYINKKYLQFAKINNEIIICFDTSRKNSAEEWDIINFSNNFLITKTISSFLTNKIWAWIERNRMIWAIESY